MACWGSSDISKSKSVFVWPSATARQNKEGMKTLTFNPGMTEIEVKGMLVSELGLACSDSDVKCLVDGYSQECFKLSDISTSKKGYHVVFFDERTMEIAMLKQENEKLKAGLANGGGGGVAPSGSSDDSIAENKKLKKENSELKTEIRALTQQLESLKAKGGGAAAGGTAKDAPSKSAGRLPTLDSVEKKAAMIERGGLAARASGSREKASGKADAPAKKEEPKPKSRPAPARASAVAPPPSGGKERGEIQNMKLPAPVGAEDGTENYNTIKDRWLQGKRTMSGEALEAPEDEEFGIDELMLGERPKDLKNPVPLQSLIDALAAQWRTDNVL